MGVCFHVVYGLLVLGSIGIWKEPRSSLFAGQGQGRQAYLN